MKRFKALSWCWLLLAAHCVAQTPGSIDSTFGTNGIASSYFPNGLAFGGGLQQSDGKFVISGFSNGDFAATRFTAEGVLDSSYGTNGKVVVSIQANDIPYGSAIQTDDKVIIVGTTTSDGSHYDFAILRLNTDGTLDSAFGTNGKVIVTNPGNGEARAVAVQPDGKIVIVGSVIHTATSVNKPMLVRLTSAGALDPSFGGSGYGYINESAALGYGTNIYALALQPDGKILIAGTTNSVGAGTSVIVIRILTTGAIDNSFPMYDTRWSRSYGGYAGAYALGLQSDGRIIVGGYDGNDFYLLRFSSNAAFDGSFGSSSIGIGLSTTAGDDDAYTLKVLPNDQILIAGKGDYNFSAARYNANGTIDNTFGTSGIYTQDLGGYDEVYSIATTTVGGKIVLLGRNSDNFVALRLHGFLQTDPKPTVQASAVTGTLATQLTATIKMTKGNGSGRIVIANANTAVTAKPIDGLAYTANVNYGSGQALGNGDYVLYNGTDSVFTMTGLVLGKTYQFAVYEFNGTGSSKNFLQTTAAAIGSYTVEPLTGHDGSSYAVRFDGSNDYLSNAAVTQGSGPFTVEAWIWVSNSNLASAGLFNRSSASVTADVVWKFNLHNSFARIDFYYNAVGNGKTIISTATVKDETWHHIAGGFDGTNIFLYVDGNLQGVNSMLGNSMNVAASPLVLGYDACCGGRPFNGMIAEMRIWNVARTQAEIREDMNKRILASTPGLSAYYHFDNGSATAAYDSVTATSATLVNFDYNSGSGFVKSNPPFGWYGTSVTDSGSATTVRTIGTTARATINSHVDSANTLSLYSFGNPETMVADVPIGVADQRSQITWGVAKRGSSTINADLEFDYSGTSIHAAYAKLLQRSSAAAVWADVSDQFTHDSTNRKFTKSGTTTSGEYSIGTSTNDPLAVELNAFTAEVMGSGSMLRWTTATETNNVGWEVERKSISNFELPAPPMRARGESTANMNSSIRNPQSAIGNSLWSKVGFVSGSGTSNTRHEYSFGDRDLAPGRYAYRLKQVDRVGVFTYSASVELEVGLAPKVFSLSQNYPNPFNPSTTIEFTIPTDGRTSLKIYNMLGQQVAKLVDGELRAGEYQRVTFDASRFASGIYIARLESGGRSLLRKLTLVK